MVFILNYCSQEEGGFGKIKGKNERLKRDNKPLRVNVNIVCISK